MSAALAGADAAVRAALDAGLPAGGARVEALERGEKSVVYRLVWDGVSPGSCVVKHCSSHGCEGLAYEQLLPALGIPALHCFASTATPAGSLWLVLEDAGDEAPELGSTASQRMLTTWAAALHEAGRSARASFLGDASPAYFAARLDDAEVRLVSRLDAEQDHDDRETLERCVERCRRVRDAWPLVETICEGVPFTVVHGDLVEENLRLRRAGDRVEIVPLDWEKAAWGLPAIDLIRLDPALYWRLTRSWLCLSQEHVSRLVVVGRIFRVLTHRWTEKSVGKAERAEARLATLMDELSAVGRP